MASHKYKSSTINFFLKMILFVDIALISIGATFIYLSHKNIAPFITNATYQQFVFTLNEFILVGGIFLVVINFFLFISLSLYSRQKYFRILERIDFDDLESAINLTKTVKSMDEFGYMGEKIREFLEVYLKFSNMKRLRIDFESKKFHALLNILEKGAIFLVKEKDSYLYKIRALNNKAVVHLNLKDKKSIVLGKEMDSILEKNSSALFYSVVDAFTSDKTKDVFSKPEKMEIRIQTNLVNVVEASNNKQNKEIRPVYSSFFTEIYPFIFKWNYDLNELEDESEQAQTSVADSILLVFQEKKLVWKGEINV